MAKHAYLSPSAAHRWLNCPAAPRLEAQLPDTPSPAAALGTAAHAVAERCLKRWQRGDHVYAMSYLGAQIETDIGLITVDVDMVQAVDLFLEEVRRILDGDPLGESIMEVERKVSLPFIRRGLSGTADLIIERPLDRLIVRDYKHGTGVRVDAEGNPQIRIYGLGALWDKKSKDFRVVDEVDLGICQPRILDDDGQPAFTSEVMEADELIAWGNDVLKPACKAAMSKKAKPNPGDWCHFCKANGPACPAASEAQFALAQQAFTPIVAGEAKVIPPDPENLTPEQLRRVFDGASALKKWVDNVHKYLYRALEEGTLRYEDVGLKLVPGRASRDWSDPDGAIALAKRLDINPYTEPSLLSPAQMEGEVKKVVEDKKDVKTFIKDLGKFVSVTRGKNIAPIESDKPALPQPTGFTTIE